MTTAIVDGAGEYGELYVRRGAALPAYIEWDADESDTEALDGYAPRVHIDYRDATGLLVTTMIPSTLFPTRIVFTIAASTTLLMPPQGTFSAALVSTTDPDDVYAIASGPIYCAQELT